jgi:hypothetical protein
MEHDQSFFERGIFDAGRIGIESVLAGVGYAAFLAMVYSGVLFMTEGRENGGAMMYCTQSSLDFRFANFGGGTSLKTLTDMGVEHLRVRVPSERHRAAANSLITETFRLSPHNLRPEIPVAPLLPRRITVEQENPCSVIVSLTPRI